MSSYQPNIPSGIVDLDQDYLNIKGNFQQLNTTYGIDHVAYSVSLNNGYHKALHLIPQAAPAAISGIGELYTQTTNDGVNTGQQVFYQFIDGSAVTINIPLTRNFLPAVGTNVSFPSNGYTFLPGGFIFQWGSVSATSATSVPVVFSTSGNINFPASIFNVQVSRIHSASSPGSNSMWVQSTGLTTSGFTIHNDDGHSWIYNWTAIGI